jgi:hypothetical protein
MVEPSTSTTGRTDAIWLLGDNAATNDPRMLTWLAEADRNERHRVDRRAVLQRRRGGPETRSRSEPQARHDGQGSFACRALGTGFGEQRNRKPA